MHKFKAIFAVGLDGEYASSDGKELPWGKKLIKGDSHHFKEYTVGNVVMMGRKTFESLPSPLSDRYNIVFSNQYEASVYAGDGYSPDYGFFGDNIKGYFRDVHDFMYNDKEYRGDYILIGGLKLIKEALPLLDEISISTIAHTDKTSKRIDMEAFYKELASLGFVAYSTKSFNNALFHQKAVYVTTYIKMRLH